MFEVNFAEGRDTGRKRPTNQDFVGSFEPDNRQDLERSGSLYVLADGVGGASEGDRASQYAVQKLLSEYYSQPNVPPAERLRRLFREAGDELYEHAEQNESMRRMATTMVAAVVIGDRLIVANVGDSRAYLIRQGRITQITEDHNLVGEMTRRGELTEEEAQRSRVKNRLTRSIGGETDVRVDVFDDITLQPGDRIFLCSDGLTRYATGENILELAREGNPEEVVRRAIAFANQRGGADNISATLIEIGRPLDAAWAEADIDADTVPVTREEPVPATPTRKSGLVGSAAARYLTIGGVVGLILAAVVLAFIFREPLLAAAFPPDHTATAESAALAATHDRATELALIPSATHTLSPSATWTITPTSTFTASATPGAPPFPTRMVCDGAFPSRLTAGRHALVDPTLSEELIVFEEPDASSSRVADLEPGDHVFVVPEEDLVCTEQAVWWQVRIISTSVSGWVTEWSEGIFWLVPDPSNCVFPAGKDDLGTVSNILGAFGVPYRAADDFFYYPVAACGDTQSTFTCDESERTLIEDHEALQTGWWILIPNVAQDACRANGGNWIIHPSDQ